jgi:hypothetical protein
MARRVAPRVNKKRPAPLNADRLNPSDLPLRLTPRGRGRSREWSRGEGTSPRLVVRGCVAFAHDTAPSLTPAAVSGQWVTNPEHPSIGIEKLARRGPEFPHLCRDPYRIRLTVQVFPSSRQHPSKGARNLILHKHAQQWVVGNAPLPFVQSFEGGILGQSFAVLGSPSTGGLVPRILSCPLGTVELGRVEPCSHARILIPRPA